MAYKFKERLIYFLDNGYWHGFRFLGSRLGSRQCQSLGKLFWLTVIITSGLGMGIIFQFTLQNFQQDVINVNVETSFLHWTNTFPAISMCLTKGGSASKIQTFLKDYWELNNITSPKNELTFALWVRTNLFVSPNQNIDENEYCESQNRTCGFDVDTLQKMFLPQKCSDFMLELTFLGRTYDCNDIFIPIKTEMGQCFTANSLHIDKDTSKLPLLYDQSYRDRVLSFKYIEKWNLFKLVMYVHSPEELPYFDMEPVFLQKLVTQHFFYQTIEIINSNNVRLESIDQRKCRFPDERLETSVYLYSFSTCFTEKRIELELELCNCTIHASPTEYNDRYCDYKGLLCVRDAEIPEIIKSNYKSQKEMCIQSCIEMEINSLGGMFESNKEETELSKIVINVLNTPTIRYVRNVTKTRLDFVVSIGGLVGLFFGASLLSLVEFAYIWLIRKF